MRLLFQPSPPPCIKCGTTTVVAPAFEDGQRVFVVRCPACGRAGTYSLDYGTLRKLLDHGAASVGGLVVWGRPRQLARSAVETSARPRDGSGAYSAEMAKAARLNANPFRRPTAESIDEPHYGNTPRRCPTFNFRPAIALCAPHPM